MPWQFLVTDLKGAPLGEVTQASGRTVTLPHLRVPSASFTVPMWHDLAPTIMDTECLLRCYRTDPITGNKVLAFHGPIVSAEEVGDVGTQNISVTAAGAFWRLTKRLIPASTTPQGFSYGSASSLGDLGTIARQIISDTNGVAGGFTGIDNGTHANSTSGWIGKWYNKNVAEAIAELAAGISSFEFRVRPTEPTAFSNTPYDWPRIGLFDVAPVIGVTRPDAIFEYGTTKANVASYTRSKSRDGMLTRAVVSVQGWPDGVPRTSDGTALLYNQVFPKDDPAILARGLFEEVVSDAGVLDDAMRTKIGDYHVLLRKQPLERITFRPTVNARPAPLEDYEPGDTVRARAFVRGTVRFDALFRIWGVAFNVDENGNENVELELVQP